MFSETGPTVFTLSNIYKSSFDHVIVYFIISKVSLLTLLPPNALHQYDLVTLKLGNVKITCFAVLYCEESNWGTCEKKRYFYTCLCFF